MSQRTCTHTNCERPHRARGLCVTHYNQQIHGESRRHPKDAVACAVCGTTVLRRRDRLDLQQPTCSVRCRRVVQYGPGLAPPSSYDWRTDAVKRARKSGAKIVERFDREEIFDRDNWTCMLCGVRCSSPDPYSLTAATIDHVVALADGGEHSRANAQTCCLSCNSAKQPSNLVAAAS